MIDLSEEARMICRNRIENRRELIAGSIALDESEVLGERRESLMPQPLLKPRDHQRALAVPQRDSAFLIHQCRDSAHVRGGQSTWPAGH